MSDIKSDALLPEITLSPISETTSPTTLGALGLLLVGLLLKAMRSKKTGPAPEPVGPKEFSEGIGQYPLQLGRGDAA